ncbi:hypothetical protein Hdeb2414_s0448g00895911 [Helianthus debilis subsp. tardiflorus]
MRSVCSLFHVSLSPRSHNSAFESIGVRACLLPLCPDMPAELKHLEHYYKIRALRAYLRLIRLTSCTLKNYIFFKFKLKLQVTTFSNNT